MAWLFPQPFGALGQFCTTLAGFVDEVMARFDREVQFYLAWRRFSEQLSGAGLPICYPTIVDSADGLNIIWVFGKDPSSILHCSRDILAELLPDVHELRSLADDYAGWCHSAGLSAIFATVRDELADDISRWWKNICNGSTSPPAWS